MRLRNVCAVSLLVALAVPISAMAQGAATVHVVPPEARQAEGNAISTHVGFDKVRFVQAYTASYVPAHTTIHEFAWRRDGQYLQEATIPYSWWHGENAHDFRIAFAPLDVESQNTGLFPKSPELVTVFARQRLVLPDLPWVRSATQPFLVRFKLDTPYITTTDGLMIDVLVDHPKWNDWTPYALDAERREHGLVIPHYYGHGTLHLAPTVGDLVGVHVFGGQPQVPAMWILGADPLAGPMLWVNPIFVVTGVTRATGSITIEFPFVPFTNIRVQCLQFFPTTWSPGIALETRHGPLDAWLIQANGYRNGTERGYIERHTMIVTEFR